MKKECFFVSPNCTGPLFLVIRPYIATPFALWCCGAHGQELERTRRQGQWVAEADPDFEEALATAMEIWLSG